MAENDQGQKTEQPTSKRLEEAREKGQLPISRETTSWVTFLAILVVVAWLGPAMAGNLMTTMRVFIESPHAYSLDDHELQTVIFNTIAKVGASTALIFIVMAGASIGGVMLQTGLFASTHLITPDFTKLSPMKGIKRLFSTNSLVELGKSMGKLLLLGTAVFFTLWPLIGQLPSFEGRPMMDTMALLHQQAVHLIIVLLMTFLIIAIADLVWQRFHYLQGLKMTKTEVKDEYKQQEGDPMIKNRLRQIRMEKARKRMMAQVPKSDVVITNPTHYAVALQYDNAKMGAPRVLAKGFDAVALRIREVATEHKIALVSNPVLARALYDTVEIDQEIPSQHYKAVAEVISYVYKLRKRKF